MLVTTIIPVYNTAPYLSRCVDSVLSQGLGDGELEVILVDDGSTDGSGSICDDFASRYPSIVSVIHKPNGGVSSARNLGLDAATGEYIHFMDSDDYLTPGGYAFLRDNFINYDGIAPDYIGFYSVTLDAVAKRTFVDSCTPEGRIVFSGDVKTFYKSGRHLSLIVTGLYNRSFLGSIRFDTNLWIGEDINFNLDFAIKNPYMVLSDCSLYRYDVREGSAIGNRNPAMMRKAAFGYERILGYAVESMRRNPDMAHGIDCLIHSEMIPFISRIMSSDLSSCEFKSLVKRLTKIGILPLDVRSRFDSCINLIFSCPRLFPLMRVAYRNIFLPYILPKISKG